MGPALSPMLYQYLPAGLTTSLSITVRGTLLGRIVQHLHGAQSETSPQAGSGSSPLVPPTA